MSESNGRPTAGELARLAVFGVDPDRPINGLPFLTPIQLKMLVKLADWKEHYKEELAQCLGDAGRGAANITPHLVGIRKHLDAAGKARLVTHKYGRGETCYDVRPLMSVMPVP